MVWNKLISRELVDVPSTSMIDTVFIDQAWQFLGKKGEVFFSIIRNKILTHYIDFDKRDYWRFVFNKLFKSPENIKRYYEEGLKIIENLKNLNKDRDVKILFNEYKEQYRIINYNYSIGTWNAIEGWQTDFDDMLLDMIKRNNLEEKQEVIIDSIYKPWKKTALIEIQEKMSCGADTKDLVEEYQFLRNWAAVWYRPLTEKWFENFKPVEKYESEEMTLNEVKKLLKPNEKEEHYIDLATYVIFFKDWRDDLRRFQCFTWEFMFKRIAEENDLELFDLGYLTLDEIEKGLSEGYDKDTIEWRKNNPVIITSEKDELKIKIFDKDVPKRFFDIIEKVESEHKLTSVKGLPAQKGNVRGRVRIVESYHDIKRVQEGDILIANTTHPNYVPGMRKAAAFVTNEGGMVCHAAIVARELKKPCIVGTKNATKAFVDDEIVEVDANKGVVRKIK